MSYCCKRKNIIFIRRRPSPFMRTCGERVIEESVPHLSHNRCKSKSCNFYHNLLVFYMFANLKDSESTTSGPTLQNGPPMASLQLRKISVCLMPPRAVFHNNNQHSFPCVCTRLPTAKCYASYFGISLWADQALACAERKLASHEVMVNFKFQVPQLQIFPHRCGVRQTGQDKSTVAARSHIRCLTYLLHLTHARTPPKRQKKTRPKLIRNTPSVVRVSISKKLKKALVPEYSNIQEY